MTDAHSQIRTAPTLEAVAAREAVSRATASQVLRGAANVSSRARAAVEAAAEELSYIPNRAAGSRVTGRSESVVSYVDESEDRLFSDPSFLGVLRGTQTAIAQAGMQLVFTVASTPQDHERFRGTPQVGTSTACCCCHCTARTSSPNGPTGWVSPRS